VKDESWREQAACRDRDPEIWFPTELGHSGTHRIAKAICQRCQVSRDCLAYALERRERWGIWGGLSEGQRARLRYQNGRTA
jgi:WhiB family transcriptional regulator, redox-sensing transcriptional regulator